MLRVKEHEGVTVVDQRALAKQLHAAAAAFAADGAVCAFDLIHACQAFLQERNAAAAARPDDKPVRRNPHFVGCLSCKVKCAKCCEPTAIWHTPYGRRPRYGMR